MIPKDVQDHIFFLKHGYMKKELKEEINNFKKKEKTNKK